MVDEYRSAGPLNVVQIDHTTVDLIVVDEVTRQPIGRPVLTLAIDVHTRLVTGFYLALDYPSTLRAGVCVAQSVFEKGAWLAEREIDLPWPAAGLPRAVHVDNAGEFHSAAFTRALEDFGVKVARRLRLRLEDVDLLLGGGDNRGVVLGYSTRLLSCCAAEGHPGGRGRRLRSLY